MDHRAWSSFDSWFWSCHPCPESAWDSLTVVDSYFVGFQGVPVSLQIHQGARGLNGPLLYETAYDPSKNDFFDKLIFPREYCPALLDSTLYVVITTDTYPDGEVRGQIHAYPPQPSIPVTWGRVRALFR